MAGLAFFGRSERNAPYSVVIVPGPELAGQLRELSKRHPLFRHQVPPHITIKSPFYLRSTGAILRDQLEAACLDVEPFELQVHGLGSFGSSVIYARVDDSKPLRQLHQRLLEYLDGHVETNTDRYEGADFTPHLTVASRLTREDFAEAWRALAGFSPHGRILVDRVHLLRGAHSWQITRSFPLG